MKRGRTIFYPLAALGALWLATPVFSQTITLELLAADANCTDEYRELLAQNQQALDAYCKRVDVNCDSGVRCDSCCPIPPPCDSCCPTCPLCPPPCSSRPGSAFTDVGGYDIDGFVEGPGWHVWTCAPPQTMIWVNQLGGGYAEMTCYILDGTTVTGTLWAACESATDQAVTVTLTVLDREPCEFSFSSPAGSVFGVKRLLDCGSDTVSARRWSKMAGKLRSSP